MNFYLYFHLSAKSPLLSLFRNTNIYVMDPHFIFKYDNIRERQKISSYLIILKGCDNQVINMQLSR